MNIAERKTVIAEPSSALKIPAPPSVIVGTLVGFDADYCPLVIHVAQTESQALRAQTIVDLDDAHIGRQMVLQFELGRAERPIIMGVLRDREASSRGISLHVAKSGFHLRIAW